MSAFVIDNDTFPIHVQERDSLEFNSCDVATDYESLNKEIMDSAGCGQRDSRKMTNKLSTMSGHTSKDSVEERRDAEKEIINRAARARLEKESVSESVTLTRKNKVVSSNVRFLAEMIGVGPEAVRWDSKTASLPKPKLYNLVRQAQDAINPSGEWARLMYDLEIRHPSCMRANKNEAYFESESARSPTPIGVRLPPKQNNLKASSEWMTKATLHELDDRRTQCELTGQSLIEHVKKAGLWQWRVVPDFYGMGIEAAREMINVAAIIAGIIPGEIKGEIPQIAKDLAADGNAWCGLALATKHRIFNTIAKSMQSLQKSEFWNTEDSVDFKNLTEWHAAVIAKDLFV